MHTLLMLTTTISNNVLTQIDIFSLAKEVFQCMKNRIRLSHSLPHIFSMWKYKKYPETGIYQTKSLINRQIKCVYKIWEDTLQDTKSKMKAENGDIELKRKDSEKASVSEPFINQYDCLSWPNVILVGWWPTWRNWSRRSDHTENWRIWLVASQDLFDAVRNHHDPLLANVCYEMVGL